MSINLRIKDVIYNIDGRSRQMYKNTVAIMVIKVFSILIALMSASIMLHNVNRADYGILLTLTSIVGWLGCMDAGLGNGLRNILPKYLAINDYITAKRYVSSCYGVLFFIVITIIIVALIVNPFVDWLKVLNSPQSDAIEIRNLALVVIIAFCFQFLLGLINSILFAYQFPALQSFLGFCSQFIAFIALLIQVYIFNVRSVFQIGAINCLIPPIILFIGSLILYITKLKNITPSLKFIDLKSAIGILSFGIKFFVLQIITIVLFQANSIIITRVVGPEAVVEYNLAFKYISVLSLVFNIIITPIWSATTDAYVRGDYIWIRNTLRRTKKICYMTIVIGLLMVIFSKQIYELWLGKASIEISYSTTFLVLLYLSFELLYKVYGTIINGMGKVYAQMIITSVIAICYMPLAIGLGRFLGIAGVLIANALVFFLNYIWSKIQCNKLLRTDSIERKGFWYK